VVLTKGTIKAVSISTKRGTKKSNVPQAELRADFGIIGDSHAGRPLRQVSMLAVESIAKMPTSGTAVSPGDFAENITTEGLDLSKLRLGSRIKLGESAEIEITQMGKKCHGRCEIFRQMGDCIMPREGIFAEVRKSGVIKTGDAIEVIGDRAAILTVSDSCAAGQRKDESGAVVESILVGNGFEVCAREIVPDEHAEIAEMLKRFADETRVDLVLTTGGTGLGPRDVTPEATQAVCERMAPGLSELIRAEGLKKTRNAILSRGTAGVRKNTLIINLPGSAKGAKESLEAIVDVLPHAIEMLRGAGH